VTHRSEPAKGATSTTSRSRRRAFLDALKVALASLLVVVIGYRWTTSWAKDGLLPLAAALPLGFLAADVASGLVHWFGDTYLGPDTPVLGPMIIAPFREHHRDPSALVHHGWLERNGNNCMAAIPLLVLCLLAPRDQAWEGLATGFSLSAALTLCVSNQIHAWAHAVEPPRLVRSLQSHGLLLAPERHRAHHDGRDRHAYAIVCGWSNRWLDGGRILFFAERLLAKLGLHRHDEGGT